MPQKKRLFRFRPNTEGLTGNDYLLTDLIKAIREQEFFMQTCALQSDVFDSYPKYVEDPLEDVKEYLQLIHNTFGPHIYYSGLDGRYIANQNEPNKTFIEMEAAPTDLAAFNAIKRVYSNDFMKRQKGVQIACFTETCDDFVMWNHFANGHNGVCIEFEVCDEIDPNNEISLHPVSYSKKRSAVSTIELMKYAGAELQRKDAKFNSQYSRFKTEQKIFLTKFDGYRNEREWRLLHFSFESPDYQKATQLTPVRLYLGFRLSSKRINEILDLFLGDIEIVGMNLSEEKFGLVPITFKKEGSDYVLRGPDGT